MYRGTHGIEACGDRGDVSLFDETRTTSHLAGSPVLKGRVDVTPKQSKPCPNKPISRPIANLAKKRLALEIQSMALTAEDRQQGYSWPIRFRVTPGVLGN